MGMRSAASRRRAMVTAVLLTVAASCSTDSGEDTVENVSDQADEVAEQADESLGDLADSLRDEGLESIASAIQDIDFTELTASDEFTFFAPNDEAFQTLEAADIADLLADPEQLDDVLRRHLVADTLSAEELAGMTSVESEGGTTLEIVVDGDTVRVGDATISETDIEVTDGVIHVVDRIFVEA